MTKINSIGINKKPKDTLVVVAMSGGVDSSTVAGIMKNEGYKVIGIEKSFYTIKNWKAHLYNMVKQSDYVLHVGAISDTSLQDSKEMFFYNYTVTKLIVDYASTLGIRVIYSSSAANYGLGDGVPNNIYGWSKLAAEDYGIKSDCDFIALRYFNVYGPGEEDKGKMASIGYQCYCK